MFLDELQLLMCPRCATAVAARRAFWEYAPLEHLLIALAPFAVVAAISVAVSWAERHGLR
jgi:hypothetical protein